MNRISLYVHVYNMLDCIYCFFRTHMHTYARIYIYIFFYTYIHGIGDKSGTYGQLLSMRFRSMFL